MVNFLFYSNFDKIVSSDKLQSRKNKTIILYIEYERRYILFQQIIPSLV